MTFLSAMIPISELYSIYLQHPKVFTDSRQPLQGGLFVALKGTRFDGNDFARQVLDAGAALAIVDAPALNGQPGMIYVQDTLQTLQDLARYHRRQFGIPVLGITGSNGKTTTKELVSRVLAQGFQLHATAGNFNNHIGVPLTLLAMPPDTTFAVIEMGANHQGEINALSRIAEPDFGLITNIGKAHLEGFGGIEGVKKGKSELYRFLAEVNGTALINVDERFLMDLAAPVNRKVTYSAQGNPADIQLSLLSEQPHLKVALADGTIVSSQLTGRYNLGNIATAVAVGTHFGLSSTQIKTAIESYLPQNNRSEWRAFKGANFLLDAYNANPTSVQKVLESFALHPAKQKWVILGEMLELGADSEAEHLAILQQAQAAGFQKIFVVGTGFKPAAAQLGVPFFERVQDLAHSLKQENFSNVHILLKGSRGNRLEQLFDEL